MCNLFHFEDRICIERIILLIFFENEALNYVCELCMNVFKKKYSRFYLTFLLIEKCIYESNVHTLFFDNCVLKKQYLFIAFL